VSHLLIVATKIGPKVFLYFSVFSSSLAFEVAMEEGRSEVIEPLAELESVRELGLDLSIIARITGLRLFL
jgi:hypothetical protein